MFTVVCKLVSGVSGQGKTQRQLQLCIQRRWSPTVIQRIPESKRDQEEGGELDSHEELNNHLWVKARSRGGRGAGLSGRVGQSFGGPGEIKRREVSWTLTKS